jgi:hypothetical protein
MSILRDQTANGLERPLQFQDKIFMGDWGTCQCPSTFEKKRATFFLVRAALKKWVGVLGGSALGRLGCVSIRSKVSMSSESIKIKRGSCRSFFVRV